MVDWNLIVMIFNLFVVVFAYSVFKSGFHWTVLLSATCAILNGYFVYQHLIA